MLIATRCPVPHCTDHLNPSAKILEVSRRSTEHEGRPPSFDELLSWRRGWLERSDHVLTRWTESVAKVRRWSAVA